MEESQARTLTKILEQLIGVNDDNETNAQNYQRIINSIGTLEERLSKVASIIVCFDPVWPKHTDWTNKLMKRLSSALLPEM